MENSENHDIQNIKNLPQKLKKQMLDTIRIANPKMYYKIIREHLSIFKPTFIAI